MASGLRRTRQNPDGEYDYRAAGVSWLGQDVQPRLMVDRQLRILWQNDAAAEMLAARQELEAAEGVLTTTNRTLQSSLVDFVENADETLSNWRLPPTDDLNFLLLRASQLDDVIVGLCAVRTGDEYTPRFLGLDLAFNLTASEHRVLTNLLAGEEADKIARLHGVALDTTRTHIRNLYAKMGVNSRESLFARALPFRI